MKKGYLKKASIYFLVLGFFILVVIMGINSREITVNAYSMDEREEIMVVADYPGLLDETLNPDTDETYNVEDRNFQRMSTVMQTGDRIWTAWTSGGNTEPHTDNYIVVAYSDDDGKTWVDPYMVIDPLDYESGIKAQLPIFWINPNGYLFLYYSTQSGYKYTICTNPTDAIEEVVWTGMRYTYTLGQYTKPTILDNGVCLMVAQSSASVTNEYSEYPLRNPIYASYDNGISWSLYSSVLSTGGSAKLYNEAQIVQKEDGSLIYYARLENASSTGGIELAYSYDNGLTWTDTVYNLDEPFIGAGSRGYIGKLKNGNLIIVTNDSSDNTRKNMTIYMSDNDGESWDYKLRIDDRETVSYPDLAEGDDGTIAVIYDGGGNVSTEIKRNCEIRIALVTQDDIKAGELVTNGSYIKGIISKTDDYIEIMSIDAEFDHKVTLPLGTTKSEIIGNLPTSVEAVDHNGDTHTLTGEWNCNTFNSNVAGEYTFKMDDSAWDEQMLQDSYSLLRVDVYLVDETEENDDSQGTGCGSTVMSVYSLSATIMLLVMLAIILSIKKLNISRRKNDEK